MKLTVASGARSLSAWRYAAERSSRWRESDSRRTMMRLLIVGLALLVVTVHCSAPQRLPIIDMHMHAKGAADLGPAPPARLCLPVTVHGVIDPQCPEPILSPATVEAMIEQTVAILERRNIIGVLSGYTLKNIRPFQEAAPGRIIPAYQLKLDRQDTLSPDALLRHVEAGDFRVLGEIGNQYVGIAPGDKRMDPYWAFAEKLDIPVAINRSVRFHQRRTSSVTNRRISGMWRTSANFTTSAARVRFRNGCPTRGESARACQLAGMRDFVTGDRANRKCLHGCDRGSFSVERRELDFECLSVCVNVNDGADIAHFETLSRHGLGQNDSIVLLDHL
jgi:hypothetical protein